ncbi:MAG: flavodoxin family protein [Prevotella sp.]|nr:flavodoxin family protein [Prevotella sp.]
MEEKKLKAMFFNGSPRKNKNTADMLQSAMRGAETAGVETELVHLYDIDFKGCKSCFACKLKNSKCNGICALKDDLRPVLERARQADVLVLGSPVYYSYPTGVIRAFMERLCFPVGTYMYEREEGESDGHLGRHITLRDKIIPTAMILTMNCPEDYMKVIGYPAILDENAKVMEDIFGYSETLYVCNTYQFNDYSRYDFNLFSEEEKRKYRDEHYDIDLKNAYDLGKRLAEKCREE